MQGEISLCVQWGYEEVLELVKQEIGVWQGHSCGPYLFNIFSNVITIYMGEEKL
jgi:hypothetical protein